MAGKITEKYEYKTSIITSYSGKEQRIKTRQHPRHYLSYDYSAMDEFQAQWLRGIMRTKQTDVYRIPMWQDVTHLREDHLGGKALYIDHKSMYCFDNCDALLIFKHDDHLQKTNIAREIRAYNDGIIGMRRPINTPLSKLNTWVYPLRRCAIQPASDVKYVFHKGTEVTLNFEDLLYKVNANTQLPYKYVNDYEYAPYFNKFNMPLELNNKLVFTFMPQWLDESSVTFGVNKYAQKLDNTTGAFFYDLISPRSVDMHSMELYLGCREMINNMKRFYHKVGGMYKSFYCPSWAQDFTICADIDKKDNFFYTEYNNLYKYYVGNPREKKAIIFTRDFQCHIVDILAYNFEDMKDGKKWGKIMLKAPMGVDIKMKDIYLLSYLNLVRLNSDELSFDYESHEVAKLSLTFMEVDE